MSPPMPIVQFKGKKKVRVLRLLTANDSQLRKLTAFGILPGVEIEILQHDPAYVIQVGYTQLALDYEIAKNIIVTGI